MDLSLETYLVLSISELLLNQCFNFLGLFDFTLGLEI